MIQTTRPGSLLGVSRRLRELGRIRTGDQVAAGKGKTRPNKLERFRFTSPSRDLIQSVADMYGGVPQPWESPAGAQHEVYIEAETVHIMLPPTASLSQTYELWAGGGCKRRCDGITEQLSDSPCLCDSAAPECKPTTRLRVMLPKLQGLGVWRLETHSYHAAAELGGLADVIEAAAQQGYSIPAVLRLEQRVSKSEGQTRRFAVPVIDIDVPLESLLGPMGGILGQAPERPALAARPQHPEPPTLPERAEPFSQYPDPPSPADMDNAMWPPKDVKPIGPASDSERKSFLAVCRGAMLTDDQRHTLVSDATEGRTQSSKEATAEELERALVLLFDRTKADVNNRLRERWPEDSKGAFAWLREKGPESLTAAVGRWNLPEWVEAQKVLIAADSPLVGAAVDMGAEIVGVEDDPEASQ